MFQIKEFSEIDSTSSALLRDIESGKAKANICYHAERQTAGRGRYNRAWSAGYGNLMMSFSLNQPKLEQRGFLAYICAVTLFDVVSSFLDDQYKGVLQIKWPNDLLLEKKKLSGILIETIGDFCVIGIGVNIMQSPEDAAKLADYCANPPSTAQLRNEVLKSFTEQFALFEAQGFAPILKLWQEKALPKGTPIAVSTRTEKIEGVIEGLDPQGRLIVHKRDGSKAALSSGDVFLLNNKE